MKKTKIRYKKLILFIIVSMILLCGIGLGIFKAVHSISNYLYPAADKPKYYLAVGMDDQENSAADSIMIISNLEKSKRLCIISLPASTVIGHDKNSTMTLRDSFIEGGMEETKSSVENLLHIHIDQYAAVDYQSFNDMMSVVGDVPFYVEEPVESVDDPNENLRQGYQKLKGSQILEYLRYRDNESGEIGRIQRDERLLKAIIVKMKQHWALINWIAAKYHWKAFDTDITSSQMASLCYDITSYPMDQIQFFILPGETKKINGKELWNADPVEIQKVIALTMDQDHSN